MDADSGLHKVASFYYGLCRVVVVPKAAQTIGSYRVTATGASGKIYTSVNNSIFFCAFYPSR